MFGNDDTEIPESGDVQLPERLLYPIPEVAVLLSLSEREVARLIKSERLKSRKVGRRRLCHRDDVRAFAAAAPVAPVESAA